MEPLPLKDIHLPAAISWWPPALGWWLLAGLIFVLLFGLAWVYKRLTRKSALKDAKILFNKIRQQPSNDKRETLNALSALLRRTAISHAVRDDVAGLRGQAWLEYLDRSLPDAPFTQGVGHCLLDAHYRPIEPEGIDMQAVFHVCERWLQAQDKKS